MLQWFYHIYFYMDVYGNPMDWSLSLYFISHVYIIIYLTWQLFYMYFDTMCVIASCLFVFIILSLSPAQFQPPFPLVQDKHIVTDKLQRWSVFCTSMDMQGWPITGSLDTQAWFTACSVSVIHSPLDQGYLLFVVLQLNILSPSVICCPTHIYSRAVSPSSTLCLI